MPEANVFLWWDTGLKWHKTNLIALVAVVFTCIPLGFIAHT